MGTLSSVMTIAGAGLYANPPADVGTAIVANTDLGNAYNSYLSQTVISKFVSVTTLANTLIGPGSANIQASTYNTLFTISASNFPGLTDVPSVGNTAANLVANSYSSTAKLVTDILSFNTAVILGTGDLSKFCQAFMTSQGYISQANSTLNSVRNSQVLDSTFNPATGGMDTLSTGSLNQVTSDFASTSADFSLLGNLINLANLEDLGLPGELLAQIGRTSGGEVVAVSDLLLAAGIPAAKVRDLSRGNNTLTAAEEKTAYTAMLAVTGSALEQVLLLLRVRTPNIINMAQLLNPKLLLPTSWPDLLCPSGTGLEPVYLTDGSVNSNLRVVLLNPEITLYTGVNNTNSLEILEKIIPADQALANKALARSLSQIKNVANSQLPAISAAMAVLQTNSDLGAVSALTSPVPQSVQTLYQSVLAEGSGEGGEILLTDIIGTPTGRTVTQSFDTMIEVFGNIAGNTVNLVACYDNMLAVLNNTYGDSPTIIPSGPGAGTYTDFDDAFVTGLIPAANSIVSTLVSTDSDAVTIANEAWGNIISDQARQRNNQIAAEIDFANLTANSHSAVMSFTNNLHGYGLDVEPGGANYYLVSVANTASLSGQSVVASLREGRNIQALQAAGIQLDTQLSDR